MIRRVSCLDLRDTKEYVTEEQAPDMEGSCIYRRAAVSTGNTFQDLPQLRETADNTNAIYNVI